MSTTKTTLQQKHCNDSLIATQEKIIVKVWKNGSCFDIWVIQNQHDFGICKQAGIRAIKLYAQTTSRFKLGVIS